MTKQITVIIKKPGEDAFVTKIDKGLKAMQEIVGGPIELMHGDVVGLPPIVDVWFNEEGKLEGLPPNLNLICEGERFDVLVGPAFFTTHNEGETVELHKEYHQEVLDFCQANVWRGR